MCPKRIDLYSSILVNRPNSVLEVGCGMGEFQAPFVEAGIRWRGIDINADMVSIANRCGVPVELADFTRFHPGELFDVVYCSQVLEHSLEPHSFVEQANSVLRPGGLLHIDVPNHRSLTALLRKLNPWSHQYGFLQPPHHLIAYHTGTLSSLLQHHGFSVRKLTVHQNNDPVVGQPGASTRAMTRIVYAVSGLLGAGSLLVAMCQKQLHAGSSGLVHTE